jgi:signal transduction histidine kinase
VAMSELEQLKTHMLRVLAHDLRSPLSIITSYLELLNDDLAPHYNDMDGMYVNAIRQAVVRITQLTSDVLSLERLHETGDVALTPVSLGGVLEHVVAQFSDEIRQRGQALSVSIEQLAVDGDTTELREAITNLVGNAVKYTGSGGTITVLLRREGDSALLEIADTGYGIPADQQDGLFQPFHRVKTRETYAIDGTGLGLYLVKRIVERHGGNVYFHSEYGKGSDFGFRLPLVKDADV